MCLFSHLQVFICDNRPFIDSISPFVARKDVQGKLLSLLAPCPFYDFSEWISNKFPKFYLMGRIQDFAKGPLGKFRSVCTACGSPHASLHFSGGPHLTGERAEDPAKSWSFLAPKTCTTPVFANGHLYHAAADFFTS